MRANFDEQLKLTLQYEGDYKNDPHDPGGATNHGITIATLSHELGHRATVMDVKRLDIPTASAIYRKKYWNVINADNLPAGVDCLAFDIAVNSGPGMALKWLAECAHSSPAERVDYLDKRRRGFYRALKTFVRYGRGWMAREQAMYSHARTLLDAK